MISIRRGEARGRSEMGWLDSRHTFSFAEYHDPEHMGFRALRVINEDRVAPGKGFSTHPHRDMEIISYVLGGALEHKDSLGNGSIIRPGDVQRMSAGTGVTHSEWNHSKTEAVHFLQIWITPDQMGVEPSYEQRHFPADAMTNRFRLVASPDGRQGSVKIHQDALIYVAKLARGHSLELLLAEGRHAWVQLARGAGTINGHALRAGDGAGLTGEPGIRVEAKEDAEALLFDLP